jgi:hypothetical protein
MLEDVQQRLEQHKISLISLAERYAELLSARRELPDDRLTAADRDKLDRLTYLIRQQADQYGFSTFAPREIDISLENFRPQKKALKSALNCPPAMPSG